MGDSLTRIGINHLNHKLKVKKGGIEVTSGNVSGSATSTGSFGKLVGEGSSISNITAKPWSATGSFYGATTDIQITGSLSVSGNITGSFSGLGVGQKYLHAQSSAATTWTISHNFDYQYVNVDVYDGNDQIVIPTSITATDTNTITLTFGSAVSGNAIISTGGQAITERGKNVVFNQSSATTNWKVTHSIGEQYPAVTVYDDTDSVIIPQQIKASDGSKMEIIFAQPVSGNANISVGGGVPSGAITSSAQIASNISGSFTDASSSFSTRITTNTLTGSILAGTGNIQGLGSTNNVTFGSVTATGNITAQEFHMEFVSASILHTSGSTKFGDTQDDIHQMTGSLKQTGSFTTTGNISSSISSTGSFGAVNVAGMSVSNLVDVSSSFSTRVLNLKSDSGSFSTRVSNLKSDSGSFSTRVSNLKSDSGSFSTRVLNLKSDSGSFSTRVSNLKSDSGSFSSRVTTNEGKATKGFTIAMSVAL
jgi:hypothetical protein